MRLYRAQYSRTQWVDTAFLAEWVLSRALSLQSLSITQTVQTSVISKTNGGMSVASFATPLPLPIRGHVGRWSALEDNLLNKSSSQSGRDSCADEIYLKQLVLHSCYGISMTSRCYVKKFYIKIWQGMIWLFYVKQMIDGLCGNL